MRKEFSHSKYRPVWANYEVIRGLASLDLKDFQDGSFEKIKQGGLCMDDPNVAVVM